MVLEQTTHRTGPLKQKNKSHKTGRHRSKGAIDKELKGRVSTKTITKRHRQLMRKDQRRNQAEQIRKNKRDEMFTKKRSIGGINTAPFLITVLPLNLDIDPKSALSILEKCDPEAVINKSPTGVTYITIPRFKQRFSFIIPPIGRGDELTVLDYLKVSDTTLLLMSASAGEDDVIDKWGNKILNMAIAQGLPTPIVSLMDLESINPKKRSQMKNDITKVVQEYLPSEKPMNLDTNSDAFALIRRIGGQKKNIIYNKANRSHLFGEKIKYVSDTIGPMGTLQVTGYLRGKSLDVNQLVHVPGLGDFQMSQVDAAIPYVDLTNGNFEVRTLAKANPLKQVKLIREHIPDEMDAEQTWPTEEEIAMSKQDNSTKKLIKRIPKGMSDYQACWIPDIEKEDDDDDDEDDESDEDDEDDEFMSCDSDEMSEKEDEEEEENCETASVTVSEAPVNDEKYDQEMDLEEEKQSLEKLKQARQDQMWPDEMDTPIDVLARTRFQKYRGLESFRTSPWDIKENLPSDYARIFQFQNFDRTKRRIIKDSNDMDGITVGSFITIHILNVSQTLWNTYYKTANSGRTLIVYGMLPHEHQMSVMNVMLKRSPDSTIPLKSKEKLIVQCGYRRFIVNPIFSQHTNGNKHKYERFFRPESVVVATFYAPIQFPPSPILCFRENPDTTLSLVASGSLLTCTPDRIVLKRIVLSGHPLKINRKVATIRYMFFNKEDVDFFKPIRLRTRCGRLGHIKESLGTHGHMKCYFDGQLKSFDTIFLYLFKRVFPKWTYEDCIVTCPKTENDCAMQEQD